MKAERYGSIYVIKNTVNDKCYVGQTKRPLEVRWQEHLESMYKGVDMVISHAMYQHGTENFYIEELEKCVLDQLNEREIYWISHYNSYKNGYNSTIGGDFINKISDEEAEEILKVWNAGNGVMSVAEFTGHTHVTVVNVLQQFGVTSEDLSSRAEEMRSISSKPTAQIDFKTRKIIEIFPSTAEAGRRLDVSATVIQEVCRGLRDKRSAAGFFWRYVEDLSEYEQTNLIYNGDLPEKYGKNCDKVQSVSREKVRELWNYGHTGKDIATTMGCSEATVSRALAELGINNDKHMQQAKSSGIAVCMLTTSGKFIREFPSVKEAARVVGVGNCEIRRSTKLGYKVRGYVWRLKSDYVAEKEKYFRSVLSDGEWTLDGVKSVARELEVDDSGDFDGLVDRIVPLLVKRVLSTK